MVRFEAGADEGISRGFAAVMLALGLLALASGLAWIVLMRPARGP